MEVFLSSQLVQPLTIVPLVKRLTGKRLASSRISLRTTQCLGQRAGWLHVNREDQREWTSGDSVKYGKLQASIHLSVHPSIHPLHNKGLTSTSELTPVEPGLYTPTLTGHCLQMPLGGEYEPE